MADDIEDLDSADEAAVEKVKARVAEAKDSPSEPGLPSEAEMLENPPEVSVETEEEIKESRRQKRANRFKEQQERAAAAEAKAIELERELTRLRSQPVDPRPEAPRQDPVLGEIERVRKQESALLQEIAMRERAGNVTQEEIREFERRGAEIEDAKYQAQFKRFARENGIQQHNPQQARVEALRAQHPDVVNNPNAMAWAQGHYRQQLALGRADGPDLVEEAMDAARSQFGMRTRRERPAISKLAGVPRGRTSTAERTPKTIKMTKEFRGMARELYPHLSEKEAFEKWAKGPGRRHLEKSAT